MPDTQEIVIVEEHPSSFPWKAVGFLGVVGAIVWFLFGRRGSGGFFDGEGKPYTGENGLIELVLGPDKIFGMSAGYRGDGTDSPYTLDEIVDKAMRGNHSVDLQIRGDVKHGDVDYCIAYLKAKGLKVSVYRGAV